MEIIKKLEVSDKKIYEEFVSHQREYYSIDGDFCAVYAWNLNEQIRLINRGDYITTFRQFGGRDIYLPPIVKGVSFSDAVKDIFDKDTNQNPRICMAPKQLAQTVDQTLFDVVDVRKDADYIYLASDLITLKGKKFHQKRNHINKFRANYAYTFREYNEADYKSVMELYARWKSQQEPSELIDIETQSFKIVFDNMKQLGFKCFVIEIDGVIRAMTMLSKSVLKVGQVHYEKADREFEGIYSAINNFSATEYFSDCQYVNRQDDLGLEGLRKAKLSYNPIFLLEKCTITRKGSKDKDC